MLDSDVLLKHQHVGQRRTTETSAYWTVTQYRNMNVKHTEVLKNYKLFVQLVFTGDVSTAVTH